MNRAIGKHCVSLAAVDNLIYPQLKAEFYPPVQKGPKLSHAIKLAGVPL